MRLVLLAGVALASVAPKAMAQRNEPIDDPVIARIKDEGMHRSQVGLLEYNSRTHHSNMDVVDRVQPDDMRQMATVAASFAYLTAMRDDKLPR